VAADFVRGVLWNASVDLHYDPVSMADPGPVEPPDPRVLTATAEVLEGWCTTMTVHLDERIASLLTPGGGVPPSRWPPSPTPRSGRAPPSDRSSPAVVPSG
jgi:ABC-type amino acid transport substrate-binding protein